MDHAKYTPKQIAESLLTREHELNCYDIFQCTPLKTKQIINALLDQTRPMHIRIGELECQVAHLKEIIANASLPK